MEGSSVVKDKKMEHIKLKVEKTAHLYTHNTASQSTKYLWIVAHGYGQTANRIIRKFTHLNHEHAVIAPEGLNRFYLEMGKSRAVGASWMTSEDRLDEIDDFNNFLTQIEKDYLPKLNEDVKIILLGFSQGGATILRWINAHRPKCHYVVLWGAAFPHDIDYAPLQNYFSDKKMFLIVGDNDEYINAENKIAQRAFLEKNNLIITEINFEGKHEILVQVLDNFIQNEIYDL